MLCLCRPFNDKLRGHVVKFYCGTMYSPAASGSIAILTMLWRDSSFIGGQRHKKLTSICSIEKEATTYEMQLSLILSYLCTTAKVCSMVVTWINSICIFCNICAHEADVSVETCYIFEAVVGKKVKIMEKTKCMRTRSLSCDKYNLNGHLQWILPFYLKRKSAENVVVKKKVNCNFISHILSPVPWYLMIGYDIRTFSLLLC